MQLHLCSLISVEARCFAGEMGLEVVSEGRRSEREVMPQGFQVSGGMSQERGGVFEGETEGRKIKWNNQRLDVDVEREWQLGRVQCMDSRDWNKGLRCGKRTRGEKFSRDARGHCPKEQKDTTIFAGCTTLLGFFCNHESWTFFF